MEPPEQATIAAALAKLPTADAERGRELFFDSRSSAACLSCHRLSGSGNNLGPDLSGIGLRAEPEKIIQSILEPSASITEGFQLQTFVMKSGSVLSGAVLRENDADIRLVKADGTQETIDATSVGSRTRTNVSVMPTGFALLGNDAVADIAAFLGTCRHGPADP